MTQDERREYLIRALLEEDKSYRGRKIPADAKEQERLLRALMNVRLPKPISEEFRAIQDAYLTEKNAQDGITDIAKLSPAEAGGQLCLWQGDITSLKVGAIVNAANSQMCGCFRPLHSCEIGRAHV